MRPHFLGIKNKIVLFQSYPPTSLNKIPCRCDVKDASSVWKFHPKDHRLRGFYWIIFRALLVVPSCNRTALMSSSNVQDFWWSAIIRFKEIISVEVIFDSGISVLILDHVFLTTSEFQIQNYIVPVSIFLPASLRIVSIRSCW